MPSRNRYSKPHDVYSGNTSFYPKQHRLRNAIVNFTNLFWTFEMRIFRGFCDNFVHKCIEYAYFQPKKVIEMKEN